MSLQAGHKLAYYEILEPIGKGAMGEVYRAKDSNLGREVAIKVLPDEFVQDEERLRRFQREAKVLASLNHPHNASIYGLEQSGDTRYLVLELVPGETLADRIARGPIPVEEALEIATKVGEALEEAHGEGIVHRRDGREIYYVGRDVRAGTVWSVSLEDGKERKVADLTGRRGSLGRLALATDASHLYFTWEEDLGDIWVMEVVTDEET